MSERKSNSNNQALSDVEKLIILLSDLKIIESDNSKNTENGEPIVTSSAEANEVARNVTPPNPQSFSRDIAPKNKEFKAKPKLVEIEKELSDKATVEDIENKRSTYNYPFPNLLDELPFLRDIQPFEASKIEVVNSESSRDENLNLSDNSEYLTTKKREETIDLIQNLLLGSKESQVSTENISLSPLQEISKVSSADLPEESSEDAKALHLLQDILVVPEIEDLRNFKISVEQKLGIVEKQVNSPEMMNKIEELENLMQMSSLNLSNLGSKLSEMGDEQNNIPTEIARVRDRVAELEHRIYEPDQLVQLILPIIAEILNLKANQSREEMCQAIMPIIAEVIFERSQMDRVAMSHAIADILPNAISEQIRNSPQEIAKAIAPEVGAAIREQIRLDRDEIIDALAPEMGAAIKRQIDLERDSMVDALYPVIGNTIAKYFAEAIRSINEKVEQTFSVEGFQRKIRAKMQGVSEAELILKESVPFEVQAVFLIHNLSGLVMVDIQQSDLNSLAEPIDSDMLAGMLTAIRSFASECMSRSESTTELDAINYSGSKILLEVAGYCYLAVIIQGEPDAALVNKIRDIFGRIVQAYSDRLKLFDGDHSVIPIEVESELQVLMEVEKAQSPKKSVKTLIFLGLALAALICVPIGIYQYQANRDRQLEAKVLEAFASTPELAVYRLNVAAEGDRLKLTGKLPNQYLCNRALQVVVEATRSEIAIGKINNNIYTVNVPPDPVLVANEVQRLTKVLNYTSGVKISSQFKDGQVTITGQVEQPSMIPKITQTYTKIAGVTAVTNATTTLVPKLLTRIYFPFKATTLQPTDLEKIVEVQTFLDTYPDFNIKIFTKSDNVGDRNINYQLGMQRCQAVRDALIQRGVNANRLHISGIIESPVNQPSDQLSRWVEFEPTLK
ncbi:MAG: flagellar motor protein MotB [Pseudanabaena frigida]|uniref:Flagellar motor protein MotB n=1 Tax=Pseudanabaena frigida TaxID=945775 RepID=A0A2W4Y8F4_9CYAN|nr:MAG: flagellar motor protein MotB [Pseudanabaena frigida]